MQSSYTKDTTLHSFINNLTGFSMVPEECWVSDCISMEGVSSTIRWIDIWMNSSNESNCCLTRPLKMVEKGKC